MVFICFGSWYPFDIRIVTLEEAVSRWAGSGTIRNEISDQLINFGLGVPTGLLICALISPATWGKIDHRRRLWIIEVLLWLICCCLTAVVVEIGQVFFSWRHSSLIDSFLQIAGSVLGGTLYLILGKKLLRASSTIQSFFGRLNYATKSLVVLVLTNLFFQLWPFIPGVSPSEIKAKLREIKTILVSDPAFFFDSDLLSSRFDLLYVLFSGLTWLTIGLFLQKVEMKRGIGNFFLVIVIMTAITITEGLKIFVDGRFPSATNWSVSVLGLSIGLFLSWLSNLVRVKR
jgi:VanZ family protein